MPIPAILAARCLFWTALIPAALSVGCNTSPQAKEARYLKSGQALMTKKDYARAFLEFRNAVKIMPKDAEAQYQLGLAALAARDLRTAVAAFRQATELNPRHSMAQIKLAELMTASRNQDLVAQARTRLENVLAVSPDNAEASDTLAAAEWQLGKAVASKNRKRVRSLG